MNGQLRNITFKLAAYIVGIVLIINLIYGILQYRSAYKAALMSNHSHAQVSLDYSIQTLDLHMEQVEIATNTEAENNKISRQDKESGFAMLDEILRINKDIYLVSIMFAENYYPTEGREFELMAYKDSTTGKIIHTTSKENHYPYMSGHDDNWEAGKKGQSLWCRPYQINGKDRIFVAYSAPIYDERNHFIGILCTQIPVDVIANIINNTLQYKDGYLSIVSREGYIITNSYKKYPPEVKVQDILQNSNSESIKQGYNDMMAMKSGRRLIEGEENVYAYYAPITHTDWCVAVLYPEAQIMEEPKAFSNKIILFNILNSILLFGAIVFCIVRIVEPFSKTLKKATEEKANMDRDLEIASAIQQSFLPKKLNLGRRYPQADIASVLEPAKQVGGDLYDYFIDNDKLYFCIGDVSGKGVPAALLMSSIFTMFRDISRYENDPKNIASRMNNRLSVNNERDMFCTMFIGILNLHTGKIHFCNAGHNTPMWRHKENGASRVDMLPCETNIAIGVIEDFDYIAEEITLDEDDALLLYTDGITEAEDTQHQLFGEKRTLASYSQCEEKESEKCIKRLLDEVHKHANGAEQSDDITMLNIRYIGLSCEHLHLTNDISLTPLLSEWIEKNFTLYGIPSKLLFNTQLAVEEAVVNVMSYAYPGQQEQSIELTAEHESGKLHITIEDNGIAFNPLQQEGPDLDEDIDEREEGGLGIFLLKELMSEVTYRRDNGKNILITTLTYNENANNSQKIQ